MNYTISSNPITNHVLEGILQIQSDLLLPSDYERNRDVYEKETGFLISNYNNEELKQIKDLGGSIYYGTHHETKLIEGYIISMPQSAYTELYSEVRLDFIDKNFESILLKSGFNYFSQIGVVMSVQRSGLSRLLFDHYQSNVKDEYIMALVLKEPIENKRSMDFFYSLGFNVMGESTTKNFRGYDVVKSCIFVKQLEMK